MSRDYEIVNLVIPRHNDIKPIYQKPEVTEMTKIEVTTTTEVEDEFIRDIFTTALEGGIGYWSACALYRWDTVQPNEFVAVIHELDPDDDETADEHGYGPAINIDHAVIVAGLTKMAEKYPQQFLDIVKDEDYDAGDADIIVQLAIFGEVKYG
jgi:hypothetical protein